VQLVGAVPELATWFDQVRLTVAPSRFGAGIKGKVLDSSPPACPAPGWRPRWQAELPAPPRDAFAKRGAIGNREKCGSGVGRCDAAMAARRTIEEGRLAMSWHLA
jgi:hypothetical protein